MGKFNIAQIMNEQSKSEAEPDKKPFKIELLPIDKLVPSQMNKYSVADVADLKASIEMMGLQQNLLVRARGNSDTYEIISGHRRFKAMQELYDDGNTDFATIPCKVLKSSDDVMTELQLLFGNSTMRQMSDYERTYQAQRIKELLYDLKKSGFKFSGRMREIVADLLDMSPAQVGRMESINEKLSPEFKEEFKAGNIGVTKAYELSRLPQEQQTQQIAEFKQKGTVEVKNVQQCEQAKSQPTVKTKAATALQIEPNEPAPTPSVPDASEPYNITHELKISPEFFTEVENGNKAFEFRKDDRGYKVGDILRLRAYIISTTVDRVETGLYPGEFIDVKVTYILHGGQMNVPEGYAILSIKKVNDHVK